MNITWGSISANCATTVSRNPRDSNFCSRSVKELEDTFTAHPSYSGAGQVIDSEKLCGTIFREIDSDKKIFRERAGLGRQIAGTLDWNQRD